MREIIIRGDDALDEVTCFHNAGRAVIIEKGRVLMSHERKNGNRSFPGGGVEDGESYEECCIREAGEEAGKVVEIVRPFLKVKEYYRDALYTSCFYICKIIGEGKHTPTPYEIEVDAHPEWIEIEKLLPILEERIKCKAPFWRVEVREHRVLTEYLKENN
ncbi:MAG: NUDIX domain-containing protein [Clostridia bacterium]|nr:NUDIX domain-containing protein [Clostridia bacterium]